MKVIKHWYGLEEDNMYFFFFFFGLLLTCPYQEGKETELSKSLHTTLKHCNQKSWLSHQTFWEIVKHQFF